MADFVVSSVLDLLKTTIIDKAKEEAGLLLGVEDEVNKLERNLKLISAVLADAEEKKFEPGNEQLKLWLDSLKEACLDMEDALNEWRVAVERKDDPSLEEEEMAAARCTTFWNKVCGFVSCLSPPRLISRHGVAVTISEINANLDEIAKGRDRYQLKKKKMNNGSSTWRETSSFVDESKILGRDEEKKKILDLLGVGFESGDIDDDGIVEDTDDDGIVEDTDDDDGIVEDTDDDGIVEDIDDGVVEEDGPLKVISLVGMGGLGKTAMAQLVYNDQAVREHFDGVRIWVFVSDTFDEFKVVKAIIKRLGGREANTWQALLERLSESVRENKFFLVLDDVWRDKREKWEELLLCFRKNAAKGSSILVTTRNVEVATMMDSSQIIPLEKLGDEVCWSIIKKRALKGRPSNDEMLEKVGKEIAVKCKGLPLAAKAVGGLLEGKGSIREWKTVLDSQVWNLKSMPEEVFAPLMLSYHDLPLEVRRCFLFCVIYPKDHRIYVSDLISHWMSHDYLGFDDDVDWELEGRKYFNLLANRSFFQDFERINDMHAIQTTVGTEIVYCGMHDLVHDFAKYMVGDEFVTEIIQPGDPRSSIMLGKCRHLTMSIEGYASSFPRSISGAKTLRSLRICFSEEYKDESVVEGLPSLLKQSKMLRLLELERPSLEFLDQALKGGRNLIHLKELMLGPFTLINQLPEALSNLQNLTILNLHGCLFLKELPSWVGKLKKLRFLDTRFCFQLLRYPKEIAQLTCLEYLYGACIRIDRNDDQEFSIADLENLRRLRCLKVYHLEGEEVNVDELKKVQLPDLRMFLVSIYTSMSVDLEAFFETLKPHLPYTTIELYHDVF